MFTYILYPLLFIPVYIYKKFTKNKVLVTYKQKCDDEFVFTYNYGNNNDLYEKLTDLNINNYDHFIVNDDIEKRMFEIVVKFKKLEKCNHEDSKSQEGEIKESVNEDVHSSVGDSEEIKESVNEDVQSSVGDSEENAKQYLEKNNIIVKKDD
tara:strand:- start:210 stop:665 length:456 start_codon:yes stop_codon:yes gene_type:complete